MTRALVMADEIDYQGIFRAMTAAELAEAYARLKAEFADPYTQVSSAGTSSQRDRVQIAKELAACSQIVTERSRSTPRNRVRASFRR
jgi:hypothetical protein